MQFNFTKVSSNGASDSVQSKISSIVYNKLWFTDKKIYKFENPEKVLGKMLFRISDFMNEEILGVQKLDILLILQLIHFSN